MNNYTGMTNPGTIGYAAGNASQGSGANTIGYAAGYTAGYSAGYAIRCESRK